MRILPVRNRTTVPRSHFRGGSEWDPGGSGCVGATRKSRNHNATVVIRSWDPSGIRADPAGSGDCQNEPPRIHPAKGQPVAATRIHASKPVRHPVRGIPFEGPRDPRKSTETRLLLHFVLWAKSMEIHRNPRKTNVTQRTSHGIWGAGCPAGAPRKSMD